MSVIRRYCVETAKHIIKLFYFAYSHTSLVFPRQTLLQYSDGDPLTGASNAGGMKNRDFRPVSRFISEMIQDSHSHYRTPSGTHKRSVESFGWCYLQWPRV